MDNQHSINLNFIFQFLILRNKQKLLNQIHTFMESRSKTPHLNSYVQCDRCRNSKLRFINFEGMSKQPKYQVQRGMIIGVGGKRRA